MLSLMLLTRWVTRPAGFNPAGLVTHRVSSINESIAVEVGSVTSFTRNVNHHVTTIIGDVVSHDALRRSHQAPLTLNFPVRAKAVADMLKRASASQFRHQVHFAEALVDPCLAGIHRARAYAM